MPDTKYADLHVHTNFSDGTFTPEEVVRTARERGLSSIAICDHDCVDGILPAIKYAKKYPIKIIPGVELTVIRNSKEIHVLGYFIEWKQRWFRKLLKKVQQERVVRMGRMIDKLKEFDIHITLKRVIEISDSKGSVGRLHLARALFEAGAVSSTQKAFNKYIGDSKPCYVEDIGFTAEEAINIITRAKGVPILAHPSIIGDDTLVQDLIKLGMRGIEVFHTNHSAGVNEKYQKLADDYGILATGGSDCHGMGKGGILMGGVKMPYSVVEKLKKEAEKIRNER